MLIVTNGININGTGDIPYILKIGVLMFITTALIIISAPINIPGARSIILSDIATRFCTFVISFVSLVTSEPVENFSIFANENFCSKKYIYDRRKEL